MGQGADNQRSRAPAEPAARAGDSASASYAARDRSGNHGEFPADVDHHKLREQHQSLTATPPGAATVEPGRAGDDSRRRGWFWHWNTIITQYAPLVGLKGVGLLNSYTVWTDRRDESPHRGYAFPSQQSEADFYGEDRAELITINKILVALDLLEIRKEMILRVDSSGRRWRVPHNLYRVKERENGWNLRIEDVIRVATLAESSPQVFRYIRRVFSPRFAPIDRDNPWHLILAAVRAEPVWARLTARTLELERRASARTRAGHEARATAESAARQHDSSLVALTSGQTETEMLSYTERLSDDGVADAFFVAPCNDAVTPSPTTVAYHNTADRPDAESATPSTVAPGNSACPTAVATGNTTHHQLSPTTTTTTTNGSMAPEPEQEATDAHMPVPNSHNAVKRHMPANQHHSRATAVGAGDDHVVAREPQRAAAAEQAVAGGAARLAACMAGQLPPHAEESMADVGADGGAAPDRDRDGRRFGMPAAAWIADERGGTDDQRGCDVAGAAGTISQTTGDTGDGDGFSPRAASDVAERASGAMAARHQLYAGAGVRGATDVGAPPRATIEERGGLDGPRGVHSRRGVADAGGGGPLGDPSDVVVSLFEAANDRRATPLERVLLAELERDADPSARAAGSSGAAWVAAALRDAVEAGSSFVAPRRLREIINRWADATTATGDAPAHVPRESARRRAPTPGRRATGDSTRVIVDPNAASMPNQFHGVPSMPAPASATAPNPAKQPDVRLPGGGRASVVWRRVVAELGRALDADTHTRLLAGSRVVSFRRGVVEVQVASLGAAEKLAVEYRPLVERHLNTGLAQPVTVCFVPDEAATVAAADLAPSAAPPPSPGEPQPLVTVERADAELGRQLWRAARGALAAAGVEQLDRLSGVIVLGEDVSGALLLGATSRYAARLLDTRRSPIERVLTQLLGRPIVIRPLDAGGWRVLD